MSKYLTREECLELDVETYNAALQLTWEREKSKKGLSGSLSTCEYCGRKHVVSCICDRGQERWQKVLAEVRAVSEDNNNNNLSD